MQIKIRCPNKDCGKTLIVESEMAGKKGKCSTCEAIFLIPGTPNPASAPGAGTVNLSESPSGDLSGEPKKLAKSGPQKTVKRRPGGKSGEKYLDEHVEKGKPRSARPVGKRSDSAPVQEVEYVDYDDYEEVPPRPRPERRRPAAGDDYEDYDDYDADYAGPRRRRRDDFYEEDPYLDPYYDSPYDEPYGAAIRTGGRGRRRGEVNIGLIRAGLMILAVAGCVFSGSIGIKILVELITMLSSDFGNTSLTIWKIAEVLWMGAAIAVIVAYSFLLFFPNRNGSLGLTIAALCVGSINLIVQIVFKIIPMFSNGLGFLGFRSGGFGFGGSKVEPLLKIGLMEGLFIAEMILVALALLAFNKTLKDRYNLLSAKQMIIPAGIYGGILIVMGMFVLILSETQITSDTAQTIWKWVMYLLRLGGQGMLIWYFVSYIVMMFNTRNAVSKA